MFCKTPWSAFASFFLILPFRERSCDGFSLPPTSSNRNPQRRHYHYFCRNLFPENLEDWDHCDVEDWLRIIGFGRYSEGFAEDFGGIGVDGDRLIYLGTEDQLDHIEYQLSLIGVSDESDQEILGSTIIELVAVSEVTPELLKSMAEMVPSANRDKSDGNNGNFIVDNDDSSNDQQNFEI